MGIFAGDRPIIVGVLTAIGVEQGVLYWRYRHQVGEDNTPLDRPSPTTCDKPPCMACRRVCAATRSGSSLQRAANAFSIRSVTDGAPRPAGTSSASRSGPRAPRPRLARQTTTGSTRRQEAAADSHRGTPPAE
jgi:hypothetical protein